MKLGNFQSLKTALRAVFGEDAYTNDNAVVLTNGDQSTVATLWSTGKAGELRVDFVDGQPSQVIKVRGAGR